MTLVISMSRLCDLPIEEPSEIPEYVPIWEESFSKSPAPPTPTKYGDLTESPCKGISNFLTTSKIAYFKRKYVEDEDFHPPLHSCCQRARAMAVPEDRTHILRLSLEKLRFIEDPEVFLRRSVLINNLLKRIRGEMQNDWCLSACSFGEMAPTDWFGSQDSPYRKRLRIAKEYDGSLHDCCFYQDCDGQYSSIPFSVYSAEESRSSLPSCSHQGMDSPAVYGDHGPHSRIDLGVSAASDTYASTASACDKEIDPEAEEQKEGDAEKHISIESALPLVCSEKLASSSQAGLHKGGMIHSETRLNSSTLKQPVADHKLCCVKEAKLEPACFVMAGGSGLPSIANCTCRVNNTF
ncbi:SERTA domain-containing protein 4 isoform X2 [Callorhinchus milii]|uniref:SERTA domain-containing protein n=1 Tax=Callorhinchus milii TaxID=7868 RepID=A0A4W3H700_CALMI|nr:SERTA domain-containing protein 4 isoform X2 [Callorhinchus milii]|eukprot:gi/632950352/ref/XP_007890668.1/ PREDICTED: SERTA domain-containing protein 4 isoform X2 [Callorhinchus milii]